jgi:Tfp pilus assembly protein PilX
MRTPDMTSLARSISARLSTLRNEDGITMIITIGVLFVTSLLMVGAFTGSDGDIHLTATNTLQKKAYYAAEAGVEDYEYHLTQDGNYLSYCTSPTPANPALNQYYKEGSETTVLQPSELKTAEVPEVEGKASEEKYAIQLLPAESAPAGEKKCDASHLVTSMVEETGSATGTFRIAVTGFAGKETRTLVATFRNANFVSFVWYSKYETFDTAIYGAPARTSCEQFYGKRPGEPTCLNNFFVEGESVKGPMHTEDHVGVCGKPTFGRTATDRIEFGQVKTESSETGGYSSEGLSCGGANPQFKGTHIPPSEVKELEPPPGDEELLHVVESGYLFEGKTEIYLTGATMTVTNKGTTKANVAFPANGVIYVESESSTSCPTYTPYGPTPSYTADSGCGNAYIHGEYTSSLTIAAQNDVVINGSVTTPHESSGAPTSNAMLGLVANNFVRVYHPVKETYTKLSTAKCAEHTYYGISGGKHAIQDEEIGTNSTECRYLDKVVNVSGEPVDACDAPNASSGDLENPTIYAAILALKHAFLVDNYNCGTASLGSLNVYGAIAGLFSNGLTGVFEGSSTLIHGYPYNANYDNRLQVEEPPHFLNPIQASWYIQRETVAPTP